MATFEELRTKFTAMGCDTSVPGFCNSDPFLRAERAEPTLLEDYAMFVLLRPSPLPADVRLKVAATADFIYPLLASSPRRGACIDASCVLSEFLTRQGVWNFVAQGGATILPAQGRSPVRMPPVMDSTNPAKTGHAWVVAPPFRVIDLTIALQPYQPSFARLLPARYIAEVDIAPTQFEVEDLVDSDARAIMRLQLRRPPRLADVFRGSLGLQERISRFGSFEVPFGDARVRYVACGIGCIAEPLEQWRNLELDGKFPAELFRQFAVRPAR